MKNDATTPREIRPRFRIMWGSEIALGPGKAELLAHIREHGSINKAAKQMSMSYMRAWTLVKQMERCFREPLVHRARGGSHGGGAGLTAMGGRVLKLYERMNDEAALATRRDWAALQKLLRD